MDPQWKLTYEIAWTVERNNFNNVTRFFQRHPTLPNKFRWATRAWIERRDDVQKFQPRSPLGATRGHPHYLGDP
jgi:hypothetical protein